MSNYFYNGVELPALPEWDKTTYPYALIVLSGIASFRTYRFVVSKEPFYYIETYSNGEHSFDWISRGSVLAGSGAPSPTESDNWDLTDGVWQFDEHNNKDNGNTSYVHVWSNYPIMLGKAMADESEFILTDEVRYAASEPVPVGGEVEPDPVPTLTARDLYRNVNGKPTKLTLYKKLGGKLVPLDEHTKGGNT